MKRKRPFHNKGIARVRTADDRPCHAIQVHIKRMISHTGVSLLDGLWCFHGVGSKGLAATL